jgi:hypothetical protein
MKNKTIETVAGLAVWLACCTVFAAVALGALGFFD